MRPLVPFRPPGLAQSVAPLAARSGLLEDALGALLEAHLAPLRDDVQRLRAELAAVHHALPPMLVPVTDAAKRMGVSVKTARRRFAAGEWPGRRDGRKVLIDLSALHASTSDEVARAAFNLRVHQGDRNGEG